MKHFVFILALLLVCACDDLKVKKTSTEAILNEELQSFKWNEIDEYPTFISCQTSGSQQDRKLCFEQTLATTILNRLEAERIIVNRDVLDTLLIQFKISDSGELSLLNFKVDSLTQAEIPNIKFLVTSSLDSLPAIEPAIKRGQKVNSEFTLPIIIKVN
ncbi:conserved hypothetical protein [Formosa agariphila KMM 3901]|uniref:Lipoprotein n=1 Tax=Formosa agariphila (strain DSM 15362 / KCTC 12365 / LMG 23005 / KMM 3901 / M-2Alg 35-1) TaxID=1347342 RepID=T2KQT2_FORAG|nr:hypothetical protein [Formosa agariphila]CDF80863.1 conserved hypothetical protein [Formosa agariphila KMM 3901]